VGISISPQPRLTCVDVRQATEKLVHYSHVRLQARRTALDALSTGRLAGVGTGGYGTNFETKQGEKDGVHLEVTDAQQRLLINLVREPHPILDGVDDTPSRKPVMMAAASTRILPSFLVAPGEYSTPHSTVAHGRRTNSEIQPRQVAIYITQVNISGSLHWPQTLAARCLRDTGPYATYDMA
jgi:hypothetical protein